MFSPAGQAWLQGGSRCDVDRALGAPAAGLVGEARADVERDRERLLVHSARCPTSSGRAGPVSAADVAVGARLDLRRSRPCAAGRRRGARSGAASAGTPRPAPAGGSWRRSTTSPVLGLEDGEEAGLLREPRDPDRVLEARAPAERARDEDVEVARAVELHRALDLLPRGRAARRPSRSRRTGSRAPSRSAARSCPGRRRCPARAPTGFVFAVRAAGGVAPERCTPVFM